MSIAVRVAALVAAVVLVVVALVVRGGGDPSTVVAGGGDDVVLECPADLAGLCRDVVTGEAEVRSVPMDDLADRLLAVEAGAPDPLTVVLPVAWADRVADGRARAGVPPLERSEVGASTPLLLAVWADRGAVLAEACGVAIDALSWDCVAELADAPWTELGGDVRWGRVVPGHAAPDTALGLQATATVVTGRLGESFSLTELRDAGFLAWFRGFERAVGDFAPAGGSHLRAMVTRGPSVADVAVVTGADAATLPLEGTPFGTIRTVRAAPVGAVELVVVGTDERAVERAAAALSVSALTDAGWDAGPAGADVLRLDGGVLTALRATWDDVA